MPTPFSDIYEHATYRFSDYDFLDYSVDTRNGILKNHLISAQSDFVDNCKKVDLTDRDDVKGQYNNTLDETIIEILSTGIAYYWLSSKLLNSENLKNSLRTSEYSLFSPADLLGKLQALRDSLKQEFFSKISLYSWRHSDIEDLKA